MAGFGAVVEEVSNRMAGISTLYLLQIGTDHEKKQSPNTTLVG